MNHSNETERHEVEHGIESAVYALAPVGARGAYRPSMRCLCGFSTGHVGGRWIGLHETWEATGAEFDAHVTDGKDNQ